MSKTIIAVPVLIFFALLIIATVALCIYYLIYKRRVNYVLQDKPHSAPIPDPGNVARVILIILAVVCVIVLLIRTSELKSEIYDLQSQYNSQFFSIRSQIDQIYDDFDKRIKKENSLFSSFDYVCTSADFSSYKATVEIKAVPKRSSENMSISLTFGKYHAELTRSAAGVFSGFVDVGVFEDLYFNNAVAVISENGQEQAEVVDIDLDGCWLGFLPNVDVKLLNYDYTFKDGKIALNDSMGIIVTASEYDVKTISIITEIDGKTVDEKDITNLLPDANQANRMISVDLDGIYAAKENSCVARFVKHEDTAGLTHKKVLYYITDDAEAVCNGYKSIIYDKNGKLLYGTIE